jgi:hypothetical protein
MDGCRLPTPTWRARHGGQHKMGLSLLTGSRSCIQGMVLARPVGKPARASGTRWYAACEALESPFRGVKQDASAWPCGHPVRRYVPCAGQQRFVLIMIGKDRIG